MIKIPGPHTWQQYGVPFFKFLSSLYEKKERERKGGEGRQGESREEEKNEIFSKKELLSIQMTTPHN